MSSTIDFWDTEGNAHYAGYMLRHGARLNTLYPGRLPEIARVVRRQATAWAKECREMATPPTDDGKTVWQYRMRQAEIEMSKLPAPMPTTQPALPLETRVP